MKKFTIKSLAIFLTIISFVPMIQSENDPFKQKPKSSKIIQFTPDAAFGGVQAQGEYKKRGRKVTITDGQTIYSFHTIIENPNPSLMHNKLNLVPIGFFSNKTNRSNMPVTIYLFGLPANDITAQAAQDQSQHDDYSDKDTATDTSIIFKPSKRFSGKRLIGNYFSTTQLATIKDPSGKNNQSYTFEHVQEKYPATSVSKIIAPTSQAILIGSYSQDLQCSHGTPKICSDTVPVINLYGNLQDKQ